MSSHRGGGGDGRAFNLYRLEFPVLWLDDVKASR